MTEQRQIARPAPPLQASKSPVAGLNNAIMNLASAQTKKQRHDRLQMAMQQARAFEGTLLRIATAYQNTARVLLEQTNGEVLNLKFPKGVPQGHSIRVVDANGLVAPMIDPGQGQFLRLPEHEEPFSIEVTSPSGERRTVTPEAQPGSPEEPGQSEGPAEAG